MAKETAIKVSREFKVFLEENKQEGEGFEETIKRLIKLSEKKEGQFTLEENSHGDKLMIFNDGQKVLIPRAEILLPMLENWSKK